MRRATFNDIRGRLRVTEKLPAKRHSAFSLVELVVVVAIVSLLVAMLLPALSKARKQSMSVVCQSNLRQIGMLLSVYGIGNANVLFPLGEGGAPLGSNVPRNERWTTKVFSSWNPPLMKCPTSVEPNEDHSYVLNFQLIDSGFVKVRGHFGKMPSSRVVLMGEKVDWLWDYFVVETTYPIVVDIYKHGITVRSNTLFVDGHVGQCEERLAVGQPNAWSVDQETNLEKRSK